MTDALSRRHDAALAIAAQAAALAMSLRPPPGAPTATLKGAQDWLTEADGAVERLIAGRLAEAFPEDGFQGEEEGRTRSGALRWIVDPIDGTSNYARGRPRWCVSIGLFEGDAPILGVLDAPARRDVWTARRGHGATLNGEPVRAADTVELGRAMIEAGWSPRADQARYAAMREAMAATGAMPRAGGSGAVALAEVACGQLDAYLEPHINLWDIAGALPILAESGAIVRGFFDGGALDAGGPILAVAPGVAEALIRIATPLGF